MRATSTLPGGEAIPSLDQPVISIKIPIDLSWTQIDTHAYHQQWNLCAYLCDSV